MKWKSTSVCLCLTLLLCAGMTFCQVPEDKKKEFAAHMQRAGEYLRQKQPAKAIPELQAAVAIDPNNADAQANLGVLLFFQGNLTDSIPHFRSALAERPDLAKIQGLLGLAEVRTLDLVLGRKDLETALPLIQDEKFKVDVGLELVSLYTQSGDLDEAARILAQLKKAAPTNPQVLYAAYRTYSDLAGESMLALALAAPESGQFHRMMAHEETRQGKTNEAIVEFRKAIAIDPRLPGIHFELAELLHTSQDAAIRKEADREYQAALAENPRDVRLLCRLGEMDSERGDFQGSFEKYSKALKLRPGNADAKLGLAKALIDLNQPDKALPILEQAVKEEPTNAIAHYRLGTLYRKNGRIEDAKRELRIYKDLKDLKEKLRAQYKNLLVVPSEIRTDESDEK
jgi:Tfp pilus assembly protein PilF